MDIAASGKPVLSLRMVARVGNKHVFYPCRFLALATFGFFELVGFFVAFGLAAYIAGLVDGDKTTIGLRFWLLFFAVFTGIGVWLGMRGLEQRERQLAEDA